MEIGRQLDVGYAILGVGLFGFLSVVAVCVTCMVLGLSERGPKLLNGFARVLASYRPSKQFGVSRTAKSKRRTRRARR